MEHYPKLSFNNVTGRTLTKEFTSSVHSRVGDRNYRSINLYNLYQINLGYIRIIAYKKSDTPITLDPNTPYTPMKGFKDKADPVVK